MHEILSLAAYLPFAVLPEGVKHDIVKNCKTFTTENTEFYFLKAQGNCCDYEVTTTTWSEDEPPKTRIIKLGDLPEEEKVYLDALIIVRMREAIIHNAEI